MNFFIMEYKRMIMTEGIKLKFKVFLLLDTHISRCIYGYSLI